MLQSVMQGVLHLVGRKRERQCVAGRVAVSVRERENERERERESRRETECVRERGLTYIIEFFFISTYICM